MPRFYFDVQDGQSLVTDEGHDLPDLDAAKREAVILLSMTMRYHADDFWKDPEWQVLVKDEKGLLLFTVSVVATAAPALGSLRCG